jgi:hypothetical protein
MKYEAGRKLPIDFSFLCFGIYRWGFYVRQPFLDQFPAFSSGPVLTGRATLYLVASIAWNTGIIQGGTNIEP